MTETGKSKLIISTAVSLATPHDPDDEAQDEAEGAEFEVRQVDLSGQQHGERLDRALTEVAPEFSRSYLQQLIEAGAVQINGLLCVKSAARVKAGNNIRIELRPTPQSQAFKAEAIDLEVVFEDDHLLVINKPAGLVVHPAPGNWSGTLLNGLLARDAQAFSLPRAGIVHRLDKDTSGLMVVARQRLVMDRLVNLIAARHVRREYVALGHGSWLGPKTRDVNLPVGRDPRNRLRMAVVDLEKNPGKTAITTISLLENGPKECLTLCKLHTGRTHQIRVHMASIGHPLIGDELYGGVKLPCMQRQALHAIRLSFRHPVTDVPLDFWSPLPGDMLATIGYFDLRYNPVL